LSVISSLIALSPALHAYETPLSEKSLQEAVVIGQRNDQETAKFLALYAVEIADKVDGGSHIAQIEILTPYTQVVREAQRNLSGYTVQQAAENYRERGDTVIIRVALMLPTAYPKDPHNPTAPQASPEQKQALRPEEFWQNFRFSVKQRGKIIAARAIHNAPVHSAATKDAPSVLDGAIVWLEYNAKDVASEETLVEIVTPGSNIVKANFDLKKLR
jgi:hypothetical protein